jgi:hypothetical protein
MSRTGTSNWVISTFSGHEQIHVSRALMVCRFRNFEQLHRRLKDMPNYSLSLPPKRFLTSSLDNDFVRERCVLLDKYLRVCFQSHPPSSLHIL